MGYAVVDSTYLNYENKLHYCQKALEQLISADGLTGRQANLRHRYSATLLSDPVIQQYE